MADDHATPWREEGLAGAGGTEMNQASGAKVARETKKKIPQKEPAIDDIRVRAYEIFIARAGAPGDAVQDWLQAERELLGEGRLVSFAGLSGRLSRRRKPQAVARRPTTTNQVVAHVDEIGANGK
jgi:Protein of unknown function (DUF2934)